MKSWDRENYYFMALYLVTVMVVYFSPSVGLTRIIFLISLVFVYISKKDYLWIAWLFAVADAPGHLFAGGGADDLRRIPNYPITAGESMFFYDLFLMVYIIKAFVKSKKSKVFLFKRQTTTFIFIIFFYFLYSFAENINIISFVRTTLPWAIVLIINRFMGKEEDFHRFNKLIFPFVILSFLAQVFSIIEGEHLVNWLRGGEEDFYFKQKLSKQITEGSEAAARNLYSIFIIIYSITISFVYLNRKNSVFTKKYLSFVIAMAVISSFLTGTRGLLLAIIVIVVLSFQLGGKQKQGLARYLGIVMVLIVLVAVISSLIPSIGRQLDLVTYRYETIFDIFRGDITAGGTIIRYTERVPQIMEWINQSPLFGFGYSNTYFENADNDIGFHTLILNVGYVGAFILYLLFLSLLARIFTISKSLFYTSVYQKSGVIFIAGLLGVMTFHLTTNIAFGLTPSANGILHERYMIYGLFLVFFNNTYLKSISLRNQFVAKT